MAHKKPIKTEFDLLTYDGPVKVAGWESAHALGIAENEEDFVSVMLMPGSVLAAGFSTLDQVHRFNLAVLDHRKPELFVGTSSLQEFYRRAGGYDVAKSAVDKLIAKVKEKST